MDRMSADVFGCFHELSAYAAVTPFFKHINGDDVARGMHLAIGHQESHNPAVLLGYPGP